MTAHAEVWRDLAAVFAAAASPRLPMDEWVAKYRRVVGGPRPGPWNPANAPMSLEPMRAVSDRRVAQVTICAPAQLLKSEFAINCAVKTAADGDDVLFYEPDLPVLQEFVGDRIRPAIIGLEDGAITEDATGGRLKKRDSALVIRFAGGGKILGLTPGMRTGKSAYTAPMVVLDEVDKMGEPSMITVARSRTATYGTDAKIVAVSTPTVDVPGSIWRLWTQGSRGVWRGRCQHCKELSSVGWGRVKFDKDEDGYWLADTAAMICEGCGAVWSESDRQRAVRSGEYVHDEPDNKHRSFHVPGPAHLWVSLESIAHEGAEAYRGAVQDGTWDTYQLFWNERLGEIWTDEARGLSARRLQRTTYSLGSRGTDDLGELDRRTVLVTAGADVGEHALYTEFVAWGVDPKTGSVLSWGLRYQTVGGAPDDTIEDAELWRAWERVVDGNVWRHAGYEGSRIPAQRVLIDSGYRPEIVRGWCEAKYGQQLQQQGAVAAAPYGARILPLKSKPRETGEHPVDLGAGTKRPHRQVPRFPALVGLESNQIKDAVYESVLRDNRLPEGAPRSNHWPVDREAKGYTEAWFREFANEVKMTKRTPRGAITTQWAGQGRPGQGQRGVGLPDLRNRRCASARLAALVAGRFDPARARRRGAR